MSTQERAAPAAPNGRGWLQAILVYRQPRMLSMLLLGFSAGLPFYLVYSTLSAWLRQEGIQRSTITMLAWVGTLFALKFLWAPIVDRAPVPFLTRLLGRRRSWMLVAQVGIAIGIFNLSLSEPSKGVLPIALWALFLAFCAATQDISIDAWRIESAGDRQAEMAGAYQFGYRIGLIAASAGALSIAADFGWHVSYATMAALVVVGVITTLVSKEPQPSIHRQDIAREERVIAWLEEKAHWPNSLRSAGSWFIGAVICPFVDFFGRYGVGLGVTVLAFLGTYRLTEFAMGSMANPFYIDHGYTLDQIALVVKVIGLSMALVGVVLAGLIISRIGILRSLVLGSIMIMMSNVGFATLAASGGPSLVGLGVVNGFDNLAQAMHGTALITFLSGLTSAKYTATQYALFSSLYALLGKIIEGFSGFIVEAIEYPAFFLYTASLSVPALVLLYFLTRRMPLQTAVPDSVQSTGDTDAKQADSPAARS